MTPIPAFAKMQDSAVEMALVTADDSRASMMEVEVALRVLLERGNPQDSEHLLAVHSLNDRVGRFYGKRPVPAKWEAP